MSVMPECVYVCVPYACLIPTKFPQIAHWIPRNWIHNDCEPSCGFWVLKPGPQQEQQMLLTTALSVSPAPKDMVPKRNKICPKPKITFVFYFFVCLFSVCVCFCLCMCTHSPCHGVLHLWKSEDSLRELVLFLSRRLQEPNIAHQSWHQASLLSHFTRTRFLSE